MGFITQEQRKEIAKDFGEQYAELYAHWFDTYAEDIINKWHADNGVNDGEYDADELIMYLAEKFVEWIEED